MVRAVAKQKGFSTGMAKLAKVSWAVPNYTTLSRREAGLDVDLSARYDPSKKRVLIVDATGLKVFGEGEWKVPTHGTDGKRRTWRKIHLLVDRESGHMLSVETTESSAGDAPQVPKLLPVVIGQDFHSAQAQAQHHLNRQQGLDQCVTVLARRASTLGLGGCSVGTTVVAEPNRSEFAAPAVGCVKFGPVSGFLGRGGLQQVQNLFRDACYFELCNTAWLFELRRASSLGCRQTCYSYEWSVDPALNEFQRSRSSQNCAIPPLRS